MWYYFLVVSRQLYPFTVLLGGVLVWYDSNLLYVFSTCFSLKHAYGFTYWHYFKCRDYLSPSDIMGNYPHLVVLGTGLAFGFLVVRYLCFSVTTPFSGIFYFSFSELNCFYKNCCYYVTVWLALKHAFSHVHVFFFFFFFFCAWTLTSHGFTVHTLFITVYAPFTY